MFEFYCWHCGNDLELKVIDGSIIENKVRIPVEPCQACLTSAKDEAECKGYEEGQSAR